jgi:hypothetical protein
LIMVACTPAATPTTASYPASGGADHAS